MKDSTIQKYMRKEFKKNLTEVSLVSKVTFISHAIKESNIFIPNNNCYKLTANPF